MSKIGLTWQAVEELDEPEIVLRLTPKSGHNVTPSHVPSASSTQYKRAEGQYKFEIAGMYGPVRRYKAASGESIAVKKISKKCCPPGGDMTKRTFCKEYIDRITEHATRLGETADVASDMSKVDHAGDPENEVRILLKIKGGAAVTQQSAATTWSSTSSTLRLPTRTTSGWSGAAASPWQTTLKNIWVLVFGGFRPSRHLNLHPPEGRSRRKDRRASSARRTHMQTTCGGSSSRSSPACASSMMQVMQRPVAHAVTLTSAAMTSCCGKIPERGAS